MKKQVKNGNTYFAIVDLLHLGKGKGYGIIAEAYTAKKVGLADNAYREVKRHDEYYSPRYMQKKRAVAKANQLAKKYKNKRW